MEVPANGAGDDATKQKQVEPQEEVLATTADGAAVVMPTPTPTALVRSGGVLARYEQWVLSHSGMARNMETMLYVLPQLVPGKFKDPDVATQSGYSMVGVLGLYHDYIMYKAAHSEGVDTSSRLTRLVRVPLSLVSHVQVLSEVLAGKFGGEAARWRLICWIELFKSVCKLILVMQQRRGLLIAAGKYKTIHPPGTKKSPFARFTKAGNATKPGSRTGKVFGTPKAGEESTPEEEAAVVDPTVPTTITFSNPTEAVEEAPRDQLLFAGELLHILRPVMYAMLRQRRGESSWLPAVVALAMESTGLVLSASAFDTAGFIAVPKGVQNKKATDELASRKMALLLYLLRDPVYASITRPATEKLCGATDYVPGFGKLFRMVSLGILDYYHRFHFYTSVS